MDADVRTAAGRPRFLNTLAAATAVTVSLAACGGPTGTTSSGSSSGGTLNVGVLAPYTGDNAVQGAISSAGCLAGIAPVNVAGGVLGVRLACKPFDTKGDPADAVPAANQMLSSANSVMVIGPGDEAVATAPIVTAQQVTNFATIGDPGQFVGHPYAIGDFDSVTIMALAMTAANSTSPRSYNGFITKVTNQSPGATGVHSYPDGLVALKAGKTIQYVGASGALIFSQYHSAGRAFAYENYDPADKSMRSSFVIPGTALNG